MADNEELIQIDVNDVTFVDVPETTVFSQGEQGPPGVSPVTVTGTGYIKWSGSAFSAAATVPWGDLSAVPTTFAPSAHTHPWSDITGAPTTVAGYGITDALSITLGDARYSPLVHTHAWSSITATPTTLAGYGITDAYTKTASDAKYALIATTLAGYGVTDAYTKTASDAKYALIGASYTTTQEDARFLGINATAANSSQLLGGTWAVPGTIGSTTPNTGAFTALSATGQFTVADGSQASPAILFSGQSTFGLWRSGADTMVLSSTAASGFTPALRFLGVDGREGRIQAGPASGLYAFGSSSNSMQFGLCGNSHPSAGRLLALNGNQSVTYWQLCEENAANILALRNGVNAQTFRIYNTFTDAANYERWEFGFNGTTATIAHGNAGTGAARGLCLNGTQIEFRTGGGGLTGGSAKWLITAAGLIANTDNAVDIGASGANRPRTMYLGTALGIGVAPTATAQSMRVTAGGAFTATIAGAIFIDGSGPAATTSTLYGVLASPGSAASAYTLSNLVGFRAATFSLGAGSTVTNSIGFWAGSSIASVGTNTWGFYSDIANATNTFAFYNAGTAVSRTLGSFEVLGGGHSTLYLLSVSATHSNTGVTGYGTQFDVTAPATMTGNYYNHRSVVRTAAAAFTISQIVHFNAEQTILGAGSTISNARGFYAQNAIAVGTSNYGYYSDIATKATTWQLYMGGTAESYFGAPVGIGTNAPLSSGAMLYVNIAHPSTTSVGYVHRFDVTGNAAMTSTLAGVSSSLRSPASAITLTQVQHFIANQTVLGAGSTISTVFGYVANSSIVNDVAASTTYGFYSSLNTGTNATVYQSYMSGTAFSYFGGEVGIKQLPSTDRSIYIGAPSSAAANLYGLFLNIASPATATGLFYGVRSVIASAASAYTLSDLSHFVAFSSTKGAGSTITTLRGFYAANAIAVGTNNYGFYSDIASAATTWQLYMSGTADSYFGGTVGILSTAASSSGAVVKIGNASLHPSSATTVHGVLIDLMAPSTATGDLRGFNTVLRSTGSAFTLGRVIHYLANSLVVGATSTVTNSTGFFASNGIANPTAGATTYGFYSDINVPAAGTTYQLYLGGAAASYINSAGGLVISAGAFNPVTGLAAGYMLAFANGHQGAQTTCSVIGNGVRGSSTTTTRFSYYEAAVLSAAAAYTLTDMVGFIASAATLGAGSTVTNVKGFWASTGLAGVGASTYGFYSDISSAANTFAFYGSGTADSSFGGGLYVRSAVSGLGYATGAGGTVTQATSKSTGVTLSKNCGQITMNGASLAAATIVSFVVTNTSVAATDLIHVQHQSGGTLGAYSVNASAAAGSFTVQVRNNTAGALLEAIVLSFAVIKGVTA